MISSFGFQPESWTHFAFVISFVLFTARTPPSFLPFLDFVVFKTTLDLIFRASLTSFGLTKASYRQIV